MNTSAILIIGPAWVGDMVMAQTLFKLLKQLYPEIPIDVVAPSWTHALLHRMPEIRTAIASNTSHGKFGLRDRVSLARHLKKNGYQKAYILPNSWKSALIPWLAKIPERIGWRGEWRYGLINDIRTLDKAKYKLMIERFAALAFAKASKLPDSLPYPKLLAQQENLDLLVEKLSLTSAPILVLAPGAEYGPAKRWPTAYFAATARHFLSQSWQVIILGSAKDQAIANEIISELSEKENVFDLTGKTSLTDAIDLIHAAKAMITNDSGLMHVAASVETPLVAIYGSSTPSFTPPLSTRVKILSLNLPCSPCFKRVCPLEHLHCLTNLKPDAVINGLSELLSS